MENRDFMFGDVVQYNIPNWLYVVVYEERGNIHLIDLYGEYIITTNYGFKIYEGNSVNKYVLKMLYEQHKEK